MKFKDLKSILSCADIYEIFYYPKTFVCDNKSIDGIAEKNGLNDMYVNFVHAYNRNEMYISLSDSKRG